MELFVLLLFCPGLFAVKHSVIHFIAGVPDVSEFFSRSVIDGSEMISCDGSKKILEIRHDWLKKILDNNPTLAESFSHQCFVIIPNYFRDLTFSLEQQFNQSEGVHILQSISGCEWDENTNEVFSFFKYGYNGEDFLKLDVKTLTWNALKPEADIIRQRWNADTARMTNSVNILTHICPERLKMFVEAGKSSLQRTVFPSVSLLQRTPSSPVSCHATGFYPDRAMMFWRKDGEELHEGVDHREILPNNDETFQMSVDLNVSSVTPEDWRRYDCAFQLSDGKDNLTITKLNKAAIRSNWGQNKNNNNEETASDIVIPIIAAVILLVLILFSAVGVAICKKKKEKPPPLSSGNISELSERLNGDAK